MKPVLLTMSAQAPPTTLLYVMDIAWAARREPLENRLA